MAHTDHHVTVKFKTATGDFSTVCLHKGDSLIIPVTISFEGGDPIVLAEATIVVEEIDE
jgi:hypothetical protein